MRACGQYTAWNRRQQHGSRDLPLMLLANDYLPGALIRLINVGMPAADHHQHAQAQGGQRGACRPMIRTCSMMA